MTSQTDFIRRLRNAIVNASAGTGLYPSVVMAQAALETGWGKSQLSSVYNNLFGIKADKSWKGPVVEMPTREVINGQNVVINDGFRVYESVEKSIKDRNNFLKRNPRYTRNGVFSAKSPEEQAQALQRAGYATDPNYATLLIRIINQFELKTLDQEAKKKG
jgi:flagellar rod assembly protein/muramidase FlgJ